MSNRLLKFLPWTALAGGVLAVSFLIVLTILHSRLKEENTENRRRAFEAIEKIQAYHPKNIYDPVFKSKIEETLNSQYIATIWLISPEGEILLSKGSTAGSLNSGSVREHATVETHEILNSLPPDALKEDKRILLLAASAIQREGAHNDIYNHLIREIHSSDGTRVGLIGVAYTLSPNPGSVATGWIVSVLIVLFSLPLYWLSLPLWVFLDARQRGERAWPWAIFVSIGNLIALIAYLLTRLPNDNVPIPKY